MYLPSDLLRWGIGGSQGIRSHVVDLRSYASPNMFHADQMDPLASTCVCMLVKGKTFDGMHGL